MNFVKKDYIYICSIAYIIGVEKVCISTTCLDETNFNAQFDSGTTFTSLPDDIYKAVVKEVSFQ